MNQICTCYYDFRFASEFAFDGIWGLSNLIKAPLQW
ncbi:unnamed protein product [Linum tenue]|uniref:Uncharacterized protein n=1 Tax=Linum tenue TaxID=586396 RepID=A0AAV0NUF8_9ROSI|nr:unnamed protein product [Linum tenue]